MWEKKTNANIGDAYTWSTGDPWDFDGTAADYINELNTEPCYAGYCNWRLPEVGKTGGSVELETIVRWTQTCLDRTGPCIDPIFGPTAASGLQGKWSLYWSAITRVAAGSDVAWFVSFIKTPLSSASKGDSMFVRAVRTIP